MPRPWCGVWGQPALLCLSLRLVVVAVAVAVVAVTLKRTARLAPVVAHGAGRPAVQRLGLLVALQVR
ncbi:hypothetical protein E4T65_23985 [Pseudomonas fluorescens]|uniref:Uncharacterized protein n=1 Tax=Pseudomonas fluorescens TaxID=294 RepID=A0A4Y9TC20_PSEFL|nr:hypothetical protein E4T65_23985 [Pseudomonas fluorescens]